MPSIISDRICRPLDRDPVRLPGARRERTAGSGGCRASRSFMSSRRCRDCEARDRDRAPGEDERRAGGPVPRRGARRVDQPRAGPRRRARPRRDLSRHTRADGARGQGPLRDRGLRRLRRADDQRAGGGSAHRRGRRRQDLRPATRAGGAHTNGRDRPRRRDAGALVTAATLVAAVTDKVDTGDTAWMLTATALVIMMTPALGLFYAGLVRAKSTLNTFMMCVAALGVATVTWAAVGYSLAFDGDGSIIGGRGNALLYDVPLLPRGGTPIPPLRFFPFPAGVCL